jgi:hypothetical protein
VSATSSLRTAALPLLGAVLVSGVVGAQIAYGGGAFTPLRPDNPCSVREVTSVSTGTDGLTERLVTLGLDRAACRLGTSREALLLQLASQDSQPDAQINALRAGLLDAVDRMKADGTLPSASDLVDQAVDQSNLSDLLKAAIHALPDSAIDRSLTTDGVLRNTVNNLDLRTLLANLGNPADLTQQIDTAVSFAVEQSLLADVRNVF